MCVFAKQFYRTQYIGSTLGDYLLVLTDVLMLARTHIHIYMYMRVYKYMQFMCSCDPFSRFQLGHIFTYSISWIEGLEFAIWPNRHSQKYANFPFCLSHFCPLQAKCTCTCIYINWLAVLPAWSWLLRRSRAQRSQSLSASELRVPL